MRWTHGGHVALTRSGTTYGGGGASEVGTEEASGHKWWNGGDGTIQ